jgi:hypothetical protein
VSIESINQSSQATYATYNINITKTNSKQYIFSTKSASDPSRNKYILILSKESNKYFKMDQKLEPRLQKKLEQSVINSTMKQNVEWVKQMQSHWIENRKFKACPDKFRFIRTIPLTSITHFFILIILKGSWWIYLLPALNNVCTNFHPKHVRKKNHLV